MGALSLDDLNRIGEELLAPQRSLNLGPFIVGLILDTLLCGVLFMQCGAYVALGKKDRLYLKTIVGYVLVMNVVITVYTWVWMYDLFVYNFGTYGTFLSLKYLSQYYVLDSMTVIVVQGFFALRAWRVANRNLFVLAIIATLSLAAFGGGIAVKVIFTRSGSTLDAGDVKIPAYIWLFSTVLADLIITAIILRYLLSNKTGRPSTDSAVGRIVRVTFESQLPPTLVAIGLAVEYSIQYSSFIAIPFICVQAKFYGISLLHTLNARETLKSVNTTITEEGDIEFARRSHNTFWLNSRFTAKEPNRAAVKGDTHRHTQFTIMPEPRTRRVKAESIDTISFVGVDLGDDDDPHTERDIGKISEVDLEGGNSQLDAGDETLRDDVPQRARRGGESKLASMGMAGGINGMEGERRRY